MPDYDVGVLELASPPASAVLTSYRPAVSVRNNGIHDAIASGYLRIYSAGLLIFETEVYSGTLSPGATDTADAVDYWTPEHEGTYIVQGYVTTPLDQVEPNNNLAPVTVIVSGEEPPEPPTVPLHASQHEEGGTDPVNVDGLPGVLRDRQLPSAHAAQHQAGQSDALNVAGLAGVLGDAQTPIQHGNAHHTPYMATSAELTAHQYSTSAHNAATNLEKTADKNAVNGYCGLDATAKVPAGRLGGEPPSAGDFLRADQSWADPSPDLKLLGLYHDYDARTDTLEHDVGEFDFDDQYMRVGTVFDLRGSLKVDTIQTTATLNIRLYWQRISGGSYPRVLIAENAVDLISIQDEIPVILQALIDCHGPGATATFLTTCTVNALQVPPLSFPSLKTSNPTTNGTSKLWVTVQLEFGGGETCQWSDPNLVLNQLSRGTMP